MTHVNRKYLNKAEVKRLYENSSKIEVENLRFAAFERLIRYFEDVYTIPTASTKPEGSDWADTDLPGMWERADFMGGATDCDVAGGVVQGVASGGAGDGGSCLKAAAFDRLPSAAPKAMTEAPAIGMEYWINFNGAARLSTWEDDSLDRSRWSDGNVYATRSDALAAKAALSKQSGSDAKGKPV